MGKCILTGEETSTQFKFGNQTIFLKQEIFNLMNEILNGKSNEQKKVAYDKLLSLETNVAEENKVIVDRLNHTLSAGIKQEEVVEKKQEGVKTEAHKKEKNEVPKKDKEVVLNKNQEDVKVVENKRLSKNEYIVKQWEYANGTINKEKATKTLTITNKRVINEKLSKHFYEHNEIKIDSIVGVDTYYKKGKEKNIMQIISAVAAALFLVVGIILAAINYLAVGVVFILIGLLMGISSLFTLRKAGSGYFINIKTVPTEKGIYISSISGKFNGNNNVSIKINSKNMKDIIKTLGDVIEEASEK